MKLSVVIPVYNEQATLRQILERVRLAPVEPLELEIVVVDDCSSDGSRDILKQEAARGDLKLVLHEVNQGKGAAVRSGLRAVTGDVVLIQDADLEYDPADYPLLLKPILNGKAKVVYGSRFLGEHKAMYFWHALGNRFVTLLTNVLFDTTLTDMETCYKVFTSEVARRIELRSPRWGFDPEITARILRMGYRIYEVPISYAGREYHEGKKITWKDGFVVLFTLLRYRFLP
ncbi:MAG: glycosyltransferase family 2 protein [Sphingomonadaceae bacterium]